MAIRTPHRLSASSLALLAFLAVSRGAEQQQPSAPAEGGAASTTQGSEPADGRTGEEPTPAARGDRADEETNTELIEAAERGDAETVRRLLEEGAERPRSRRERTALVAAAYGNHPEAARALIEAGADVNAKDDTEQSAYLI